MSNESNEMNNSDQEFDLFAKDVDDNLQEQLAKGTYKWTNKYTAVLGVLVIVTASVSGGIWYGNKHAGSSANSALAGFASRVRGAGGAAAAGGFGAAAGAAGAAGFAGAGAGGFGGGARITGTVSKVNGTTVTITLDAPPSTPIAVGDSLSVRATGAGGAGGAAGAPGGAPAGAGGAAAGGAPVTTGAAGAPAGAGPAEVPGAGGGGGGRFNNPAFTACLAKNGVTLAAGTPPDRTDPKVAAAMQACISTLGAGAPGAGGAAAGGRAARPTPTATP